MERLGRCDRGLSSELELTVDQDHVPRDCVVNLDNIHTLPRNAFRQRITSCHQRAFMMRVARYEPAPDAECDLAEPKESAPQVTDR
jgi:hypothetical protein